MNARMPNDAEFRRMEQAADWLIRLRETPGDEKAVADWLQWCETHPDNLGAFQRAQSVWQAAGSRPRMRRAQKFFSTGRLAIAASLLCMVAGTLWFVAVRSVDPGAQSYATPVAGQATSVLPDGSKMELGANSRVSMRYSNSRRTVAVESGEAYFTVAHDALRPFVVIAGGVSVTALGTAFNVRRVGDRIVVAVSEGKVRVAGLMAQSRADSTMEAGQQAVYVIASRQLAITPIRAADAASWRQGVLKYLDEPLSAVAADLNRYSARRIEITDPRLASLTFTGTVLSAHIDDAVRGFEDVFPLRVTEKPDRIELAPK